MAIARAILITKSALPALASSSSARPRSSRAVGGGGRAPGGVGDQMRDVLAGRRMRVRRQPPHAAEPARLLPHEAQLHMLLQGACLPHPGFCTRNCSRAHCAGPTVDLRHWGPCQPSPGSRQKACFVCTETGAFMYFKPYSLVESPGGAFKSIAELMYPRGLMLNLSMYQSGVDFKCPYSNRPLSPGFNAIF
jgi:hypothetical protein